MAVVKNAGVVQQRAEVPSGNILLSSSELESSLPKALGELDTYHGKIYALIILKSVQQLHQPLAFRRSQDIPLRQDMPDLVQLEKQLFAHDFQRAHFLRVFLLRQIHLSVATLSDLRKDLEVAMTESCATFAQVRSFPAQVLA